MFPTSTNRLQPGDVCFIPKSGGGFVPFIFICSISRSRTGFYGALGDASVSMPEIEMLPPRISLSETALVHITSFKENNTPITGNILTRIDAVEFAAAQQAVKTTNVGAISKVWGHKTILRRADAVA